MGFKKELIIFFLLNYITYIECSQGLVDFGITGPLTLVSHAARLIGTVGDIHRYISHLGNIDKDLLGKDEYEATVTQSFQDAAAELLDISKDLNIIHNSVSPNMEQIRALVMNSKVKPELASSFEYFVNETVDIAEIFTRFNEKISYTQFNLDDLCAAAREMVSIKSQIVSYLEGLYRAVVPIKGKTQKDQIVKLLLKELQEYKSILCGLGYSPHEALLVIFNTILLSEIKVFIMLTYERHLLKYGCDASEVSPEEEMVKIRRAALNRLLGYNTFFVKEMRQAPRDFRACAVIATPVKGTTHFELEGLIRSIVYPPSFFAIGDHRANPEDTCAMNFITGIPDSYCHKNWKMCVSPRKPCHGYTYSCHLTVVSTDCPPSIKSLSQPGYAAFVKDICQGVQQIPTSQCVCKCNDNSVDSNTTHVFSLQSSLSDIKENMIVIGVRFLVQNRIVYLQIHQGKLLSNWSVIPEEDWKPINDISREVYESRHRGDTTVVENEDYVIITVGKNNAFHLDDCFMPADKVLTGVKFALSARKNRLVISAIGTKWDYTSAVLNVSSGHEIHSPFLLDSMRKEYKYDREESDFPELSIEKSRPIVHEYITINKWKMDNDSGTITAPFFDLTPVRASPPAPLGGIGITIKGVTKSSPGILTLKLISQNYALLMSESGRELAKLIKEQNLSSYDYSIRNGLDGYYS